MRLPAPLLLCGLLTLPGLLAAQPAFQWPAGKRVAVSFSFDDARASQIDVGVPLFDKYGAKVTFYVNPPNMEKRLDGWKKAAAKGYEIGNHSQTHPCTVNFAWSRKNNVEDLTVAGMERQMDQASHEIERMLGVKAVTYAYPCGQKFVGRGAATKSTVPLVAQRFLAGRGFRDESSNAPLYCDLSQLMGYDSDGLSFERIKALVLEAREQGAWIVFGGHEIGGHEYQTTEAAALEQFLKYAQDPANGIWLETVEHVARYVQDHRAKR
jgi:peptidoglycan/xylan/chitin deacetylase (PgdA/CDA1 family)